MDRTHPRHRITTLFKAIARFQAEATAEWINRMEDYGVRDRSAFGR